MHKILTMAYLLATNCGGKGGKPGPCPTGAGVAESHSDVGGGGKPPNIAEEWHKEMRGDSPALPMKTVRQKEAAKAEGGDEPSAPGAAKAKKKALEKHYKTLVKMEKDPKKSKALDKYYKTLLSQLPDE